MVDTLIVDKDAGFRKLLGTVLEGEGYSVTEAASVKEACELTRHRQYDVVFTDLRLPDGDGLQVLDHLSALSPETAVVMITSFATADAAGGGDRARRGRLPGQAAAQPQRTAVSRRPPDRAAESGE